MGPIYQQIKKIFGVKTNIGEYSETQIEKNLASKSWHGFLWKSIRIFLSNFIFPVHYNIRDFQPH